jgi:hypothetical protein
MSDMWDNRSKVAAFSVDLGSKYIHIRNSQEQQESVSPEYIFHIGQVSALYKIANKNFKFH